MPPTLTEDEIDEILYCARANEQQDLTAYLDELSQGPHAGASRADLLAAAVDPESGNSALHYAAANGHVDIVNLILAAFSSSSPSADTAAKTAYINGPNAAGNTPLHWACLNGHLGASKALVGAGAAASALNHAGHDAVFEAERNGKEDVVAWLLVEGGALDAVVGALRDEEKVEAGAGAGAGEGSAGNDGEGEDVEMRISVGDTSGPGVEEGVEGLSLGDGEGKGKGKASG